MISHRDPYGWETPGEDTAASRDASWYDRPNVRHIKQVHVAYPERWQARCSGAPLDDMLTWRLADVPDHRRCRRRGCVGRWPSPAEPADVAPTNLRRAAQAPTPPEV